VAVVEVICEPFADREEKIMTPSEYLRSVIEWLQSEFKSEHQYEVRQSIVDNIHYLAEEAANHMREEAKPQDSE